MKKYIILRYVVLVLFILCTSISALAHSGGTDSSGGHTDHDTGDYHYHHGYPAHDHWDIDNDGDRDCPYTYNRERDYDGNTNSSTSKTNAASSAVPKTESKKDTDDSKPLHEQILEASVLIGIIGLISYELFNKK